MIQGIKFVSRSIEITEFHGEGVVRPGEKLATEISIPIEGSAASASSSAPKDTRSLYEQLAANRALAEEVAKAQRQPVRAALDEDEAEFLEKQLREEYARDAAAEEQAEADRLAFQAALQAERSRAGGGPSAAVAGTLPSATIVRIPAYTHTQAPARADDAVVAVPHKGGRGGKVSIARVAARIIPRTADAPPAAAVTRPALRQAGENERQPAAVVSPASTPALAAHDKAPSNELRPTDDVAAAGSRKRARMQPPNAAAADSAPTSGTLASGDAAAERSGTQRSGSEPIAPKKPGGALVDYGSESSDAE